MAWFVAYRRRYEELSRPSTGTNVRAASVRTEIPATTLAREAIDCWLREQKREATKAALEEYAAAVAGTIEDFDPDVEAAGLEHLAKMEKWGR
jgi:hypothetical protein